MSENKVAKQEKNIEQKFYQLTRDLYPRITEIRGKKYDGKETYGSELNRIGRDIFKTNWLGVFYQNETHIKKLNKSPKGKNFWIINNEITGQSGEHWVAVYRSGRMIYVLETFGRKTKDFLPLFWKQMTNEGYTIKDCDYDKSQQSRKDDCGMRCLAWLILITKYGIRKCLLV